MYNWFVWLHIIGVLGFVMSHGVSAGAAFALKKERRLEAVRSLLDLSSGTLGILYGSILLLLVAGVVNGFIGKWWGYWWIWISLVLFIGIIVYMGLSPSRFYARVRKAAGLPYFEGGKPHPAVETSSPEEIASLLDQSQPVQLTVIGFGGLVFITLLMVLKPF